MNDGDELEAARLELGLSYHEVWVLYSGVGGRRDAFTLRGYLNSTIALDDGDHDDIALALNEAFNDIGVDHPIAYRLT